MKGLWHRDGHVGNWVAVVGWRVGVSRASVTKEGGTSDETATCGLGSRTSPVAFALLLFLFLLVGIPFPSAEAQLSASQLVCLSGPVVDEMGRIVSGNDKGVTDFGFTHVPGDLVQIFLATDNVIYPPSATGQHDPRNQLLCTVRIGCGTVPYCDNPGGFGAAVSPRPPVGTRIFVRVFNAPTLEKSGFYADSELFYVDPLKNRPFVVSAISRVDGELDPSDPDQDGISTSWEKSYGTHPNITDSDCDGMKDGEELRARTDPLDAADFLQFAGFRHNASGEFDAEWDARAGVHYRVEGFPLAEGSKLSNTRIICRLTGEGRKAGTIIRTNKDKVPRVYRVVCED